MQESYITHDSSEEPMSIHPSIIDRFKKEPNTDALIAMYMLYYHTARWQKTNRTKANDTYIRKCLSWGADKTRKTKKKLIEFGLIEKHADRADDGTIKQWYIKVRFMFNHMSVSSVVDNQNTPNPQVAQSTSGCEATSALSLNNRNALSLNNKTVGTRTEIPTVCFDITDMLIKFVQTKHKLNIDGRKRRAWADHIRKMHTCDKIEYERIGVVVQWYTTYDKHTSYCPVVESAKTLRDKWTNLVNYGENLAKQSKAEQEKHIPKSDTLAAFNRIRNKKGAIDV